MQIISHTNIETLADKLLEDVLSKDNFSTSLVKGGFLTGGNIIVCESKGLQEYLKKICVDNHGGIWAGLPFKPLTGLLMRCAYSLAPKYIHKDEKENIFDANNLVWAIFKMLKEEQKTFSFASEISSLFEAYQIYRGELIEKWNKNEPFIIKDPLHPGSIDENFRINEIFQRNLWGQLKKEYINDQDIYQVYNILENELKKEKVDKKFLPKQIFIFAPLSIAPIHLSILSLLAKAGCKVKMYLLQVSTAYIGTHLSDKKIAKMRKEAWKNNKILDEHLYWDLGNRLTANLGRCAQVLYEQIGDDFFEYTDILLKQNSLLETIQVNIINDNNEKTKAKKDDSIVFNNCFSPLREIEVLSDYILSLFDNDKDITAEDIAIVSPNIETYANAIETVFGRYKIPYKIADRDIKKYDNTAQLLNRLFSLIGSEYKAPDIVSLFEYSCYVQGVRLENGDMEHLKKWIDENAIRYGLNSSLEKPDYSFKSGLDQLAAGFFMIAENNFSEIGEYCYPDIEGKDAYILGNFFVFFRTLQKIEEESKESKSIEDWDEFFRNYLPVLFGTDTVNFNEDIDTPYQKVINAWDSLKSEMYIGFGASALHSCSINKAANTAEDTGSNTKVNISVLKMALLKKLEAKSKSSYAMTGRISCSNIDTARAVPRKVICCISMNYKEFPRQVLSREISLMKYRQGDKDITNEDRMMFLETILSARKKLYISWTGQDEKNAEEIDPSSVVVLLLNNLKEQYKIKATDIITKHPLQPFSGKYFDESSNLFTYDNRWTSFPGDNNSNPNIWKWEITAQTTKETDENKDIDYLYTILNDVPKYFLKVICNIILPEDIPLLKDTEPFIVEKGLEKWQLGNLILQNTNYENEIKIQMLKGILPSGNFADLIIENIISKINEMQTLVIPDEKTLFLTPGKDKGKYRLKHWLQHLKFNMEENEYTETNIILLDKNNNPARISLWGVSKIDACKEINKLWELADKLNTKLLPIFPGAAWEYISSDNNIIAAQNYFFEHENYSQYTKMAMNNSESHETSFEELGIESDFIKCSELLFGNYKGKVINE